MHFSNESTKGWRRVLDPAPKDSNKVLDFLRERYVEEVQRIDRFKQHAERMHYPQDREKFSRMAQQTQQHAAQIAKKIGALGGALPDAARRRSTEENSWQSLTMALDEEHRSAARLPAQLLRIEPEHPDIAKFLRAIAREQENQRRAIQQMLMRSDPFAHSLA